MGERTWSDLRRQSHTPSERAHVPAQAVQGGAAEYVATQLDARLREHLKLRSNLLNEGTPGMAASLSRPLLCLFDRNFELSVVRPSPAAVPMPAGRCCSNKRRLAVQPRRTQQYDFFPISEPEGWAALFRCCSMRGRTSRWCRTCWA